MVDFRRSRTRDVGVVLVLALLVVDGVLLVMALRNQPEPPTVTVMDPPSATPTDSPTPERTTPSPSPTPSPSTTTPTPTPTPTLTADPTVPRELPLSVLDEETAVRGTPGTCADGDGSVEITEDGGASWTPLEIPDLAVLRVRVTGDDLWFIGAGEDCLADLYRDGEEDGNWDSSGSTRGAWHLLGDPDASKIHVPPDDFLPGPCSSAGATVVELESAVDAPARALCSDGSVHVTSDGAQWDPVGIVAEPRALGISDGSPLVAASGVEGCDGLSVQDLTPEGPTEVGCAEEASDDAVALAFAGQAGFLLAGGATWTTGDGGVTWTPAA